MTGLTPEEVAEQRKLNGMNKGAKAKSLLVQNILSVVMEPMFILLMAACLIYFLLKEFSEAWTMLMALFFVAGIDVFQNFRSQKAIKALNRVTKSKAKVVRQNKEVCIPVEEIVTQDILICEEGTIIPADAEIVTSNDFSVNEAILTGESFSIEKFEGDSILQGTVVVRGYCYARVKAIGLQTTLSGIGKLVTTTGKEQTPLQLKISKFVRLMVITGSVAFIFVWGYHWWESGSLFTGLLHGLTMAMSVLPEEIPVALSTFMALGAYRLLKSGVIARSPKTVETLGSATVICLDKTGTLTQNLMRVSETYDAKTGEEVNFTGSGKATQVLEYAMWASEENPFDPMEKSIHQKYTSHFKIDKRTTYRMVKEFPLAGSPPVMTHIFQNEEKDLVISCKGALEGVLNLCNVSKEERVKALAKGKEYALNGLRVLGVARGEWSKNDLPELQKDINFTFLGIITFYDPPDMHIAQVLKDFYDAGISVKMITGDYLETAVAIARLTGIKHEKTLTGSKIAGFSDKELENAVTDTHIFARVSPEIKYRIINALKQKGEVVSMTGDGVNDAPALKSAHIGIAMGKRGTEVAKSAAGLILSNDNLTNMTDAIFLGRRINENLSKAIRYIISIHIPIILLVTFPIFLGWLPAMLFTPIHVIFLELIMGPTCSITYENEPIDRKELKKPIPTGSDLFTSSQLIITIIQGLFITLGCLIVGYYASSSNFSEMKVRSFVFSTLLFSNIFLTLINRSFTQTIFQTIKRKNLLIPGIITVSFIFLLLILYAPMLNKLFKVEPLGLSDIVLVVLVAFVATFWFEFFKYFKYHFKSES